MVKFQEKVAMGTCKRRIILCIGKTINLFYKGDASFVDPIKGFDKASTSKERNDVKNNKIKYHADKGTENCQHAGCTKSFFQKLTDGRNHFIREFGYQPMVDLEIVCKDKNKCNQKQRNLDGKFAKIAQDFASFLYGCFHVAGCQKKMHQLTKHRDQQQDAKNPKVHFIFLLVIL